MIPLIAQASTVTGIYGAQRDAAIAVNRVIEALQEQMVSSEVFFWVSQIAMLFGAVLVAFAAVRALKKYSKNHQNPMPIFWGLVGTIAMLTLILNTGGGSNLGRLSLAGSKIMNRISETPIAIITRSAGAAQNIIEQAGTLSAVRANRDAMLAECLKQPESKERDDCLNGVIQMVDDAVSPYVSPGGGGSLFSLGPLKLRSWPEEVLTNTKELVLQYRKDNESYLTNDFGSRLFGGLAPILGIPIAGISFVIGTVFTYLSGIAQTVLILVAPILVVLSFTDTFGDSFKSWLKTYAQLGLMRLIFNLLVSFAAWANLATESPDPILFPLLVAILSAVFSVDLVKSMGSGLIGAQARLAAGFVASQVAFKSLVRR